MDQYLIISMLLLYYLITACCDEFLCKFSLQVPIQLASAVLHPFKIAKELTIHVIDTYFYYNSDEFFKWWLLKLFYLSKTSITWKKILRNNTVSNCFILYQMGSSIVYLCMLLAGLRSRVERNQNCSIATATFALMMHTTFNYRCWLQSQFV